jgi:PhoPQ-activated pathogenicity-related protein
MKTMFCLVCLGACGLLPPACRADLQEYLKKPEPKFSWKVQKKNDTFQGTVFEIQLVSQTWQDTVWEHSLQVFLPKKVEPTRTMFLWNTGGKPDLKSELLGFTLAQKMNAPVAFLFGIPNQPLLDGKKEDALIAETFVRYLDTRDENWPLLFPMTKSLVKAMDALQQFAKEEWKTEVKSFVVSGASKRGWTTWLTAAADPRVKAIVPMVFDMLCFDKQLPHQLHSFGKYSDQIKDYTQRGLIPSPDTASAKKLWCMVDPWFCREKLAMPKLIINGSNDPYWTVDALNLYWDDLKGDKWVLYVPNARHGLEQKMPDERRDLKRAVNGVSAFARQQIHDQPMPKLKWRHDDQGDRLRLVVDCDPAPLTARLWLAQAETRDFREALWKEEKAELADGKVTASTPRPRSGFQAYYAEMDFEIEGLHYQLSTQLRVVEGK